MSEKRKLSLESSSIINPHSNKRFRVFPDDEHTRRVQPRRKSQTFTSALVQKHTNLLSPFSPASKIPPPSSPFQPSSPFRNASALKSSTKARRETAQLAQNMHPSSFLAPAPPLQSPFKSSPSRPAPIPRRTRLPSSSAIIRQNHNNSSSRPLRTGSGAVASSTHRRASWLHSIDASLAKSFVARTRQQFASENLPTPSSQNMSFLPLDDVDMLDLHSFSNFGNTPAPIAFSTPRKDYAGQMMEDEEELSLGFGDKTIQPVSAAGFTTPEGTRPPNRSFEQKQAFTFVKALSPAIWYSSLRDGPTPSDHSPSVNGRRAMASRSEGSDAQDDDLRPHPTTPDGYSEGNELAVDPELLSRLDEWSIEVSRHSNTAHPPLSTDTLSRSVAVSLLTTPLDQLAPAQPSHAPSLVKKPVAKALLPAAVLTTSNERSPSQVPTPTQPKQHTPTARTTSARNKNHQNVVNAALIAHKRKPSTAGKIKARKAATVVILPSDSSSSDGRTPPALIVNVTPVGSPVRPAPMRTPPPAPKAPSRANVKAKEKEKEKEKTRKKSVANEEEKRKRKASMSLSLNEKRKSSGVGARKGDGKSVWMSTYAVKRGTRWAVPRLDSEMEMEVDSEEDELLLS